MHNQLRIRMTDRLQHLLHEANARSWRELLLLRVHIERHAFHVLHHQVRLTGLGHLGVEQACDIRSGPGSEKYWRSRRTSYRKLHKRGRDR